MGLQRTLRPSPSALTNSMTASYYAFLSQPGRRLEPRPSSSERADEAVWTRINER